ncbi:MAG: rod shape-determining protein MreD [Candidatus Methylomirabilia bacterium]
MREHLYSGVLALAVVTLQTSGGSGGSLFGLHPDLVLLFVLATGMRHGETSGALWGIALGLVADTFSAGLPGANLLTKGLLGFAAGNLRDRLDCDNPNTQAIVAAIATLLQGAVHLSLLEVFSAGSGVLAPFLGTIAPAAALNGALLPAAALPRRAFQSWRGRRLACSGT